MKPIESPKKVWEASEPKDSNRVRVEMENILSSRMKKRNANII